MANKIEALRRAVVAGADKAFFNPDVKMRYGRQVERRHQGTDGYVKDVIEGLRSGGADPFTS